jgi:hypothetical protein
MRRFLIKGFIFFLILAGIAHVVDYMIQEGIKTSNYREVSKWNEVIIGGIDAEILIVGSSRASYHFDCEIIEKITGKSCYNLGFDGTAFPHQKLMLDLYLKNNIKPDEIYWSLDFHSFHEIREFYGFEQLVPYYSNIEVQEMYKLNKGIPNHSLFFPIVRYSFNPEMREVGLLNYFGLYNAPQIIYKGYREQDREWDSSFDSVKEKYFDALDFKIDSVQFSDFKKISLDFEERGVKVSWVFSLYYFEENEKYGQIIREYKSQSEIIQIDFIDFSNSNISKSKQYFYNSVHMNKKGVNKFLNLLFY